MSTSEYCKDEIVGPTPKTNAPRTVRRFACETERDAKALAARLTKSNAEFDYIIKWKSE